MLRACFFLPFDVRFLAVTAEAVRPQAPVSPALGAARSLGSIVNTGGSAGVDTLVPSSGCSIPPPFSDPPLSAKEEWGGWGRTCRRSGQAGQLPYVRGSGRTASPGMAIDRFTVCVIISSIISTISLIEKRCEPPTSCARRASGAAAGVC